MPPISTRSAPASVADESADGDAARAWRSLRRHLDARRRQLNDEVAHYPQPIARCDVQLSRLLEQRARLHRVLERAGAVGDPPDCDDDAEIALRANLAAAIARATRR